MAVGIAIASVESVEDLRRLSQLCHNVADARRLLAIALMTEGRSRTKAATAADMNRQACRVAQGKHRVGATVGS